MSDQTLADLDDALTDMAESVIAVSSTITAEAVKQSDCLVTFLRQAIAISLDPENVKRAAQAADYRDLTAGTAELAKIHQLISGEADSRTEARSLNVNVEPGASPKTRLMKYVGGMLAHGDAQKAAEDAAKDD